MLDESFDLPQAGAPLPFEGAGLVLVSQRFLETNLFQYQFIKMHLKDFSGYQWSYLC